jgi:short-subunit dehydrogenase
MPHSTPDAGLRQKSHAVNPLLPTLLTIHLGMYNASKAAEEMFSETLRLEMAPLGVKVLTLVTGIIQTQITANGPEVCLPPNSIYQGAKSEIIARATGLDEPYTRTKPEVYAVAVVNDILGGKSGKVYRGLASYASWVMSRWLPRSLFVSANTYCCVKMALTNTFAGAHNDMG